MNIQTQKKAKYTVFRSNIQKKELNHEELKDLIANTNGAALVGMVCETEEKLLKTNNPFGPILKRIRTVGIVGADYEQAINNQLDKQGIKDSFESSNLPWGKWLIPNKIIEHKGQLYLRTQTTPSARRKIPVKVLSYRDINSGRYVNAEDIKPFKPAKSVSGKQEMVGLENAEEQVWIRTYKFDSINKIRYGGKTFTIKH